MKLENKWYLQTWIICLFFAAWPLLFIPAIIGIVLLALQYQQRARNRQLISQLITDDVFEARDLKEDIQRLSDQKKSLEDSVDVLGEFSDIVLESQRIKDEIQRLNDQRKILDDEVSRLGEISELSALKEKLNAEKESLQKTITAKQKEIVCLDEEIQVQEFGLYKPVYDFATALDYKEKLAEIRARQKKLIREKKAVRGATEWTVNGNAAKGRKMVSDTQKLLLRAFNIECDEVIAKVKYTNFDASLNHIYKAEEAISKLGTVMSISIERQYVDAKISELRLAFEYKQKKHEEDEAAKEARREMREAAKVQRELEEQRMRLEKEQTHYQTAYEKICAQYERDSNNPDLAEKKQEYEVRLANIEKSLRDVDYREANQKAGYVYVISNIGSFGKDVYKIGMTRRLDPQDRVDELGDASVPFRFDVHAMIFSDDAPALEAALHRAFENKKVNMVNQRREFFHVTLDEIKEVVKKNFDKTVEFIDVPDAEQYRISKKMWENNDAV